MARPERRDADYFPFYAKRGKTLNILQSKFGLEGIGFFTNLLRFLTFTPDHHYCIKDETDKMNFFAEIGIQEESRGIEIIELMVKTEKLNRELWENYKVIVSEDHLLSLTDAYKQRRNKIITIAEIKQKFVSMYGNPEKNNENSVSMYGNPEKDGHNPQRKGKETKVKKSKEDSEASPPVDSDNSTSQKTGKTKKAPLREREPVNDMERVEKAYLVNWDGLYAQGKVKATNPVVNWNQTRKQLKIHFESFNADVIIQAINNGLNDVWVVNNGYSLGTMLSAGVLNRLINGNSSGPQRHRIAADNVSQEKATSYFREVK